MVNPTDELCARLDELGVEWNKFSVSNTEYIHWTNSDGHWCAASIGGPLSLHVNILSVTPEQAIAATVGAGTCELINAADDLGEGTSSCMCFKCGYTALDDWWDEFKYCPNCGRRIKEEAE